MKLFRWIYILGFSSLSIVISAQAKLLIDSKLVKYGETYNYKASWGFITIGSASTTIDKNLYKVVSNICFKVNIAGQTNGIAKLFYVRDKWNSYIDTASIITYLSYRSIREGRYELDESTRFDHVNKKAEVKVYDKNTKIFVLKENYDTHENVRDVVAGFMVFRLVDLSKYKNGDSFLINGFYEDEGYKINVIYQGKEIIKTDHGDVCAIR